MIVGYGRVSRNKQDTALQVDAFKRAKVPRVITEKWSSVGARPKLQALLAALRPGDVFVVWKLDRVGRSLIDLLQILQRIHQAGASFRSLTEHIDTSTPAGRMLYSVLGAFAEYEHSMIRERSIAGQQAAMRRGVHCGKARSMKPQDEADLVRLYRSGWYTLDSVARVFDVHPSTAKRAVYRVLKPGHSSLK